MVCSRFITYCTNTCLKPLKLSLYKRYPIIWNRLSGSPNLVNEKVMQEISSLWNYDCKGVKWIVYNSQQCVVTQCNWGASNIHCISLPWSIYDYWFQRSQRSSSSMHCAGCACRHTMLNVWMQPWPPRITTQNFLRFCNSQISFIATSRTACHNTAGMITQAPLHKTCQVAHLFTVTQTEFIYCRQHFLKNWVCPTHLYSTFILHSSASWRVGSS